MLRSKTRPIVGGLTAVAVGIAVGWIFVALTNKASSGTSPTVRIAAPVYQVSVPASAPAAALVPIRARSPEVVPDAQPQPAPETGIEPARDTSAARKRKKLRERAARLHKDDDDDDDD